MLYEVITIDGKTLKPGMNISGPATIHPFDGSAELAKAIGLDWAPRWGINIPNGNNNPGAKSPGLLFFERKPMLPHRLKLSLV